MNASNEEEVHGYSAANAAAKNNPRRRRRLIAPQQHFLSIEIFLCAEE
jgi:hypothetical protein